MGIEISIVASGGVVEPTRKVYLHDRHNETREAFEAEMADWERAYYKRDAGGYYDLEGEWPTLSFCNANAAAVIAAAGLGGESDGEIACADIPAVRRAILLARNGGLAQHTREGYSTPARATLRVVDSAGGERIVRDGAPAIHAMGLDAEGLERRLADFDALLAEAQRLGLGVQWV
ncbi:hypothetical protein J2T57_001536 [Natronocella acetinitrilica]|uniref:Uncharacterized protein n=1 Tax=Natronocella acetinitrilica TaxID=414046 RepID=A0AAE3KB65_9GAMM|nr:hypothetical protein [Natronocella acetinitrilica]MCP1674434.1 hypothetical protein [Natronocella acetinitrilica]